MSSLANGLAKAHTSARTVCSQLDSHVDGNCDEAKEVCKKAWQALYVGTDSKPGTIKCLGHFLGRCLKAIGKFLKMIGKYALSLLIDLAKFTGFLLKSMLSLVVDIVKFISSSLKKLGEFVSSLLRKFGEGIELLREKLIYL
ncbi:MAG: hypothetical protein LBD33_02570, partial [Puniceicoccales bacterium]|nr:hypothetical protein [Puniceicoccales bacterium]